MATSNHNNHGEVAGTSVQARRSDDEANDGEDKGPHDVEGGVLAPVGGPIVEYRGAHGDEVRRNGQEKCVDSVEAKGANDGGKEVGCSAGNLNAEEDECEKVEAVVLERKLEAGGPVGVVLIHLA